MILNSSPKISIALCTYNGEAFLKEQLESIAAQTILPFELVVCDDASSDSTPQILEVFAAQANFSVKLHFNSQTLGYLKNFEKAASLCSGDIIAFSDQDDHWYADKLETLVQAFSNEKVAMAFSNATLMDEQGKAVEGSLWDISCLDKDSQELFKCGEGYKIIVDRNVVYGCTMAFCNKWWPLIKPLPNNPRLMHDGWAALMTAFFGEVVLIEKPLISYRLHPQQTTAKNKLINQAEKLSKGHRERKIAIMQNKLFHYDVIDSRIHQCAEHIPQHILRSLSEEIQQQQQYLNLRIAIYQSKPVRLQQVWNVWKSGSYHRFSKGSKRAVGDLFRALAIKVLLWRSSSDF